MKITHKAKERFVVFLSWFSMEDQLYSDDISFDPRDCYHEEALFAGTDTDAILGREKQGNGETRG